MLIRVYTQYYITVMFVTAACLLCFLSYVVHAKNVQTWKETILFRTAIAFCAVFILALLPTLQGDIKASTDDFLAALLDTLPFIFLVALFFKQRWKWQSVLIFLLPFIILALFIAATSC